MKVLFVGDGKHDVGGGDGDVDRPRPARGVVATLARQIAPAISAESIALYWREITRLPKEKTTGSGYAAKARAAKVIAARRHGCVGVIAVADSDRHGVSRLDEIGAGLANSPHCVAGLAVESIEAWTLGAPDALAATLGIEANSVGQCCPKGVHVEVLYAQSGKPEHHPKKVLAAITALAHREDSTELREQIAEQTDVDALARACPTGFAPFLAAMRAAFVDSPSRP